jgi:hypothetical protein
MISKEELSELYINQNLTPKQIAKQKGIHWRTVLKYLRKSGFKTFNLIESQKANSKRPTKEKLQELFDNYTAEKIADMFQVKMGSIYRWKEELGVISKFDPYRYDNLRTIPLNRKQKEILVGTVLGDGCISLKESGSARLYIAQCNAQKDYLFWKRDEFQPFFPREPIRDEKITEKGFHSVMWDCSSITHPDFKEFYNLFYFDGVKQVKYHLKEYLTPLSLAVLYMDDGSRSQDKRSIISSDAFSIESNTTLARIFKENFDLDCNVRPFTRNGKNYCDIGFNRINSKKLYNIVYPYMLDCLKYKIVADDIV